LNALRLFAGVLVLALAACTTQPGKPAADAPAAASATDATAPRAAAGAVPEGAAPAETAAEEDARDRVDSLFAPDAPTPF